MAETMTKNQIDAAVEGMSKPGIGGACERLRIMALTFKDAGSVAAMIPLGLAPKIARDVADVLAEIESLRSRLESAERDTERLAILNAAIEDDRLIVDNNALPPVEAYPPDSENDLDRYVVYDLTEAADELIAHAAKLAAEPGWRPMRKDSSQSPASTSTDSEVGKDG